MYQDLKKLLNQSAIYGISAIVDPLIRFVMLPLYTRYLTAEDYGTLALTGVVGMFLTSVIGLGVSSGMMRFYFQYKTKEEQDEVITTVIIYTLVSSAVYLVVFLSLEPFVSHILFSVKESPVYYNLVIIGTIIQIAGNRLYSTLRAEERAKAFTTFSVTSLVLQFGLNILFVVGFKRGVQGILEAGVISGILTIIMLTPIAVRGKRFRFSMFKLKEILSFSAPLVPAAISHIVLNLSNRYFLDYFISKKEVGLFQLGVGLSNVLAIVITKPFKIAWPPYMYSVSEKDNAKEIYRNVLVYYVFIAFWAGLAISVSAREALIILTTPPFYSSYKIVPLIIVSLILFGMMEILVAGIHITKKTKYVSYIFMMAAVINLGLNYWLIPRYGMYGAATATVLTFLFMNVSYFIYSQKLYPVKHDFARIFIIIGLSAVLFMISRLFISTENLFWDIPLKTLLILSFPVILWLTGFFNLKEKEKILHIFNTGKRRIFG